MLPSSDSTGAFHFESVDGALDNIAGSPWLNVRLGKFELDNLLSEKRILTLTGNGGIYQLYHFIPVGDGNIFGQMGDNQLGVEFMGHSAERPHALFRRPAQFQRWQRGLPYGANSYCAFFTATRLSMRASWAWSVGSTPL